MLKIDLHTHTADDPQDHIPYTTRELIDRAALLGFDALAVTLHDKQLPIDTLIPYALERGIVLIRGIERTIERKHVLLLNFRRGAEDVHSFEDLARLKQREHGLVIAPHPFFPASCCLGNLMPRHGNLFDAIEYNGMFTASVNFNRAAEPGRGSTRSRSSATATCTGFCSWGQRTRSWMRSGIPTPSAKPSSWGACVSKPARTRL